ELLVEPVAVRTDERNDDEYSPKTVNDAGNGGQKLDQILEQRLQAIGQPAPERMEVKTEHLEQPEYQFAQISFAQKNRGSDAEGRADHEREQRGIKRAPDLGQDAVARFIRVPRGAV